MTKQSQHPLSSTISGLYQDSVYHQPEHFVEVPGRGLFGRVNNMDVKIGSEQYVTNSESSGERVNSEVHVSIDDHYLGWYKISNQYREGIEEVMQNLGKVFDLYLVSGDNDSEAGNLLSFFSRDKMLFNQKPGDKADFIKSLQAKGNYVLMTGDGLNDGGALMQSDVALTIANKAHNFSPASDAILEADQFPKFASFVRFVKTSINIVKVSFLISFLYNIVGISFAISGNLSPIVAAILMPISSVSVVAFATFMTRGLGRGIR